MFPILGPENLSFNEEMPLDALKANLTGYGMSQGMTQAMVNMKVAKNKGMQVMEPRTPQSTSPTSFRRCCKDT